MQPKNSNLIDFTTMRKGKVIRRNRQGRAYQTIGICPRCGRKGAIQQEFKASDGTWWGMEVTHAGRIVGVAGMKFFEITDRCSIDTPEQREFNRAARRFQHAANYARFLDRRPSCAIRDFDWPALPL